MKPTRVALLVSMASMVFCAHGQSAAPQAEEELAKQTALLKAQQAYYDQLALTAKSRQAAADAGAAAQTASLTAATGLESAQYTNDLALATALKGSGLSAATGKDGSITMASADKMMLALQRDSLVAIDSLVNSVCTQLRAKLPAATDGKEPKAFIAPANYEELVEKSVADVRQLIQLHDAAAEGSSAFGGVQMEMAATTLAGALISASYIAGGVQAVTKLFRTDYNLVYTPVNRQGLFEQALNASCKDRVVGNVEARLRLNAAKLLDAWLPEMARFAQQYDRWSELIPQYKSDLTAKKAKIAALKPAEQGSTLQEIDGRLTQLSKQEDILAKYKNVAAEIKTYLTAIGSGTIYNSLVWGQHLIHKAGGVPAAMENLHVEDLHRISYTLNVQDTSVKSTATFSPDKIRYFATAEIHYSLVNAAGSPVSAGVLSMSTPPTELEIKGLQGESYSKVY
jgi:hypothetical protein